MEELKRMLRVIGWGILPFAISVIISTFLVKGWDRQLEVLIIGSLASFAVLTWICICRSDDDSADI